MSEASFGGRLRDGASKFFLVIIWVGLATVFAVLRPDTFLTTATFQSIFGSQSVLLVLALALLVTLIVGEFDLSVAGTLGVVAAIVVKLNGVEGTSLVLALVVGLIAAALIGLLNGVLVVKVGVDAIVVTLGMGTLLLGVSLWLTELQTIGGVSAGLLSAMNDKLFGLPLTFWYGLALTILVWYILRHTPLGRRLIFVGHNLEAARLTGLPVDRLRIGAFVAGALLAGIAGILIAGTLGAFQANTAPPFLLPAFAAVFLGSTVATPGRLNPWGTFIAIYFLITGVTGLQLLGLSGWIEDFFYGAALVVAVTLSTIVHRRTAGT